MKKTVLSNSLPKLCLAMGLMLGPGAWNAYAIPTTAEAQQVKNDAATKVTGTVLDENGDPIIGASVKVLGTDISVPTNIDGVFVLPRVRANQEIEITYVGYLPTVVKVSFLKEEGGTVTLTPTAENLNEVIVVGYGTQKKVNLTGAVQQVSSKELNARSVTSASVALQGLISGVNVTQTSGAPGTDAGIQIRGVGSMNSNSSPLVLVDGVENDMNAIDMNAIESISVLKDAASASIYGSKASNGVILVTTKRGQESRAQVSYNGWVGFRTPTELPRPANAIEFMEQMDKANVNIGNSPTFNELLSIYRSEGVDNMSRFDTNWRDLIIKDSSFTTNHSVSITGGSKSIRQFVNGSYSYEDGIVSHNNYNRWTIRSNTDANITRWLRANIDLSLRRTNREEPVYGANTLIGYALTFSPIYGAVNADGTWNDGQSGINPYAMAEVGGVSHTDGTDAIVKGSLIANPLEGLEILASYSTRRYESKSARFVDSYDTYSMGNLIRSYPPEGKSRSEGWERSMFNQFNVQASFERTFNKLHYFKAFVGFQTEESKYSQMGVSRSIFNYDGYEQISHGSGPISAYGGRNELAMVSYIGRLNYIYDEKYMLEVTGRYDGSSRFTKENRWGFFPSVSAAWRISQENFFESAREYFNNLKLRLSYGTLGNQNIGSNYPYASVLTSSNVHYWPGGNYYEGVAATTLSNRQISWEKSKQFNIGLDFSLINKIDVNFDYYVRNISSMLQRFPAPYYVGLSAPWSNAGNMRNNGWDLGITYHDRFGNVGFSATAMVSDVKNKITDLYGNEYVDPAGGTTTTVGHPIWSWYGFVADGYFQSQEEIDNYPVYNGDKKNYRPGYLKYKDISGPEGEPDGVIDDHDRTIIGDPQQRYLFSLNLTANWNNFDFTAFFQGVGKRDIYATGYNVRPLMVGRTIMESQFDTWSEDNRNAKYPLLVKEDVTGTNPNNICSSFWIKSGAYCRLKNLVVGYTLPKKVLGKSGISHLRFYLSGQNLFTIQNAYPGYDPEATPASYYPLMRVYTFGIDLRF